MRCIGRTAISLLTLILITLSASAPTFAGHDQDCLKVTLTGTGSPDIDGNRAKAGTMVSFGKQSNACSDVVLQFDAGTGAVNRLERMGIDITTIDAIFITHAHHDHTAGLPSLVAEFWVDGLLGDVLDGNFPPEIEVPIVYVPAETSRVHR